MGGVAGGTFETCGLNDIVDHRTFFKTDKVPAVSGVFFPAGMPCPAIRARVVLNFNHANAVMIEGQSGVMAKIDLA